MENEPVTPFQQRFNEMTQDVIDRNAYDESPGRSDPSARFTAAPRSTAAAPSFPSIPNYMFKKDKQSHLDELKKNQISSTSVDSSAKFQLFENILQMAGLLTLANGLRTRPTSTAANPHGFTEQREAAYKGRTFSIAADDMHKFQYDADRLYDYFHNAFHTSTDYISPHGFAQQDGIQIYKDMKKHFQGHNGNDILRLILSLLAYRPNLSVSIQEDVVRLDKIFQDIDYALGHEFELAVKMAFFLAHFQFDTRPGVSHFVGNLKYTKVDYHMARVGIEDIITPLVLGAGAPKHAMKALSSAKTELCRNFAANRCRAGDACKYVHALPPAGKPAPTPPPPRSAPPPKLPSKTVYPTYISAQHREKIGPFSARKTDSNPHGISKRQLYALNILVNSGDDTSSDTDSWRNGSIAHAAGSTSRREQLRICMLTSSSPPHSPAASSAPDEDYGEAATPLRYAAPTSGSSSANAYAAPAFVPPKPTPIARDIFRAISEYNDTLESYLPLNKEHWYVQITRPGPKDVTVSPTEFVLAIFGWLDRGPLRHISLARPDIASGSSTLMFLIYRIGQELFDAEVCMPVYNGYWTREQFMRMDPTVTNYIPPGSAGSYVSVVGRIGDYLGMYKYFETLGLSDEVHAMYELALIYDFMMFVSQTYRDILQERAATIQNLAGIRRLVLESIHTMDYSQNDKDFNALMRIFRAIACEVSPTPLLEDPVVHHKYETPNKHRRRREDDVIILSPDLQPSENPSAKFQRFSTVGVVRDYGRPPTPPLRRSASDSPDHSVSAQHQGEDSAPSSDYSDDPPPEEHQANLVVTSAAMFSLHSAAQTVFDSGCSISGTSDPSALYDVTACGPLSVQGAFGPATQPAHRGKLGPLGLDAIVIDGMGAQTLVSLSQFCEGGDTGVRYAGVFTHTDFRMFRLDSILPQLSDLSRSGDEVVRGTVKNGIYVQESS